MTEYTPLTYQIAVIGGGPAGVCAAVSAARGGAKTILLHSRAVLGGNSSSEIRVWTRGATGGGCLFAEEMGVWGDFKMRNLYTNPEGNPIIWDEVLLDLILKEPNLDLRLNTYADRVEMQENNIAAVYGRNLLGDGYYRVSAQMYIDCTGDGNLGVAAGVPFHLGKEGADEYGESLAPSKHEAATQGSSLLFFTKKTAQKVRFIPPDYAYGIEYMEALLKNGTRIVGEDCGGSDYWWVEYGGHLNGALNEMQDVTLHLKKLIMGIWNYIKNSGKFNADYYTLEWVGNYPGKRENRRMITDYVLSERDVKVPGDFADGAFYGGWYIDFHPSEGVKSEDPSCTQLPLRPYPVPLRTLYNSKFENLLFAGRNIGTTHVAFASTRIMNTCALSGQAAGHTAVWCVKNGVGTDCIDEAAVKAIQHELRKNDGFFPGIPAQDDFNIAGEAKVEVSGDFDGSFGESIGMIPLLKGAFFTIPARAGDKSAELLLTCASKTMIEGAWYMAPLPSRLMPGELLGQASFEAAGEGLVQIALPQIEKDCFVTFLCDKDSGALLHTERNQRTGFLCGKQNSSDYAYPCIKTNTKGLYSKSELTGGINRPYRTPNVWISDSLPATIELKWEQPRRVSCIIVTFDPDLSKEIPSSRAEKWAEAHFFTPRAGMPPELVRAFTLQIKDENGVISKVVDEQDNWRRRYYIPFEPNTTITELYLNINATYGSPHARVFDIAVFKPTTV